jgi:class 3 adenylate cyclase
VDSDLDELLELASSAERKVATIVFADLVGSTELASTHDPERTRVVLERFYDVTAEEIERAGGTPEKFIGDAVMAVFGAPGAKEDHAERALHAALSIRGRLFDVFGEKLALRIGVNTGEVALGRPRYRSSFVSGDAVNVAARLQQAADPGEILVGERTIDAVRGAFEFDEPTRVQAKGKPNGLPCRALLGAKSIRRPRGVAGLGVAFVGREDELASLRDACRAVIESRKPLLVTILGDAGVGKSRLAHEFRQWLALQSPEPECHTGRCLSYGRGITYWPLGEVLKEQLGLLEDDPAERALELLGARKILGLTLGLDVAGELHPLAARDRLHDAWIELADELVAERPAIILIEDLHWAEDELLDLLERLVEDVSGPLLLLCTARPELLHLRPSWARARRGIMTLELERLSADEADEMLAALLETEPPRRLRDVVQRAEGNPFFLEELLASLMDHDLLARESGVWTARLLPTDFSVPDSVQALVAARIDLLQPAEKTALQVASVVGRVFWAGPIYELLGESSPDFRVLEERDFVRRRSNSAISGEREFVFKHELTREVAYKSLPKARRAHLHAWFGEWLERFGEGRDEHASLLAHHYAEAVREEDADLAWSDDEGELRRLRSKAVDWLRRAAELGTARSEFDNALALLHRAVQLETEPVEWSAMWREIGRVNALRFDGEAFWTAMEESLAIPTSRAAEAETYSLLAFQTATRSGMWKRRPEPSVVDPWIERALELSGPDTAPRARALIARAYWRPREGGDAARAATVLAERLGDEELRSYAWMARAAVEFHALRFAEAARWAHRRFELAPRITDPDHLAEMREAAIPALGALGRISEIRRLAQEHIELSRRLSPHHRLHGVDLLVEAAWLAGDWEAIRSLEPFVRQTVTENSETPCVRNARVLLFCALACAHTGDDERARDFESAAAELGMEGHTAALDALRVALALARGDSETARNMLEPQLRLWYVFALPQISVRLDALAALSDRSRVEREAPLYLQPDTYFEPIALRALGIVRSDAELLRKAVALFEGIGLAWHASQTRKLLT